MDSFNRLLQHLKNRPRPNRAFENIKYAKETGGYVYEKWDGNANKAEFEQKPMSKAERERLRLELEERKLEDRKRLITISACILTIVMVCGYFLWNKADQRTQQEQAEQKAVESITVAKEAEVDQKKIASDFRFYMHEAYRWFEKGDYYNANFQFNAALDLKPDDLNANLGKTMNLIHWCANKKVLCEDAEMQFKNFQKKFPDAEVLPKLENDYLTMKQHLLEIQLAAEAQAKQDSLQALGQNQSANFP